MKITKLSDSMEARLVALEKAVVYLESRLQIASQCVMWAPKANGRAKHYEATLGEYTLSLDYEHFRWWYWEVRQTVEGGTEKLRSGRIRSLDGARQAAIRAARSLGIIIDNK